jgi:cell division protein FtsA
VLEPEDKEAGVILADIGGGTTDIAVFNEGSVWHTSVLPVGGIQVTRDIATGLGIPFNDAEEIKLKYGSLVTDGNIKTASVTSETQEKYNISQVDLSHILRARMEEILRMILLEIPHSDYSPSALILTGGTANMAGIEEFARQVTGLPVRVLAPERLPETANNLSDPMFASSVGLLLWGARQDQEEVTDLDSGLKQFYDKLRSIKLPRLPKIKIERS